MRWLRDNIEPALAVVQAVLCYIIAILAAIIVADNFIHWN